MPELNRFVHDSLDCNSKLIYGDVILSAEESSTGGDPLSVTGILRVSPTNPTQDRCANHHGNCWWYWPGRGEILCHKRRPGHHRQIYLKYEITTNNFDIIEELAVFKDIKRINMEDFTLLRAPILEGKAVDNVLQEQIAIVERSSTRLSKLQSHDALCLLKNLLAMPKLLYILRTSLSANDPLLHEFHRVLRAELESILNIHLSDGQLKQASLPVHMGGLGVRSACMLAPSAFWHQLQPRSYSRKPSCQLLL